MSEFKSSVDYSNIIDRLRMSAKYVPYELQLVWMYELLLILVYLHHKNSGRLPEHDGSYTVTHKSLPMLCAYTGISAEVLGRLGAYRDTFVHKGHLDAKVLEAPIFANPEQLDVLQTVTGVTLNLRNTLM